MQALEGCTSHAAAAAGESDGAGRIVPGCRADLTGPAVDPVRAPASPTRPASTHRRVPD
nr:hypothetical protein [Streptomyces sp. MUSC 14]